MSTTELYQKVINTTAAWQADDMNLEKLRAMETAEGAYYAAIANARDKFRALPEGDRKASAEENAYDTEGCDVDQLRWYEIALMTYELNG